MKIPFTNLEIKNVSRELQKASRGVAYGATSVSPERDMSGFRLDMDSLYTVYSNVGDVYACVREIRQGVGKDGWAFFDKEDNVLEDSALVMKAYDVFNRGISFASLLDSSVRDLCIAGQWFWEVVKNEAGTIVLGFKRLDPRTIYIVADKLGNVYRYLQKHGRDVVAFQPEDVIHVYLEPDPKCESFGFSPLQPILWEARTELSAMISNYFLMENDAVPGSWFLLDDGYTPEAQAQAIETIKKSFSGPDNKGKPAVLGGVKDIKLPRITPQELEYLGGRKFATEKFCAAYGVPKVMLGYTEGVNFSNASQQYKKFIEDTINPLEKKIAEKINSLVVPLLGFGDSIEFKFWPHSLEDADQLRDRARKDVAMGIITINEAREEIGYDPIDESKYGDLGDRHWVLSGANAVLLEDIGVDPVVDFSNPDKAEKALALLSKYEPKNGK